MLAGLLAIYVYQKARAMINVRPRPTTVAVQPVVPAHHQQEESGETHDANAGDEHTEEDYIEDVIEEESDNEDDDYVWTSSSSSSDDDYQQFYIEN